MKTKFFSILILVIALAATGALAGEDNAWVTDDGHKVLLHADNAMFFGDDGEAFDVSDLEDGETKTLGFGAKQVTVSRLGDAVTISRAARGDEDAMEVQCDAAQDTCKIVTFDSEPEKVMIMIEKSRQCINGVGDCDADAIVNVDALSDGKKHVVIKKVKCDEDGNCSNMHEVISDIMIHADSDAPHGAHPKFIRKSFGDAKAHLVCPEGDSTIHVNKEEADDTFLCPKHNVPMEKMEGRPHVMTIEIDD